MPETEITASTASELGSSIETFTIPSETTEGPQGTELRLQNSDWTTDYGYYLNIPEFKVAVDTKATWAIGAGFTSDEVTSMLLSAMDGNGKDSFNSILKNMIKTKTISRDSFAEIIRDKDGVLMNLKPLDPASIVIVMGKGGRIKRYEQINKTTNEVMHKFQPDEIFHLSHERIADEGQGTRILQSLEWLIQARNEAMSDWRTVLRRNVRPIRIWYLDTDDETEIAAFKQKTDQAYGETENMYVPKGAVETEIATVAPNATLNPLEWIDRLNDYFFQAVNVPQIIIGNAKEFTDASGKIVYLSYEQSVKAEQLYIEEQVLAQLNLDIQLTFPASLQTDMISSRESDPNLQAAQPNDMTMEMEGNT